MSKLRSSLAALALLLAPTTAATAGPKAAIFRFELIDVSIEGELLAPGSKRSSGSTS